MKESLKNRKKLNTKNLIDKKGLNQTHKFFELKEAEKQKSNQIKNSQKNLYIKKLEPIKVKLTPLNKRHNSKEKRDIIKKSNTLTENNHDFNKSLYLSPTNALYSEKGNNILNRLIQKNYSESRNDLKDNKLERNCTTPYRRILNNKFEDDLSPSASVIIKNFNYNNVYNFNIENDRNKNKKIGFSSKSINKNNDLPYNELYSNTCTSNFTYNKPKTSTGITSSCISTKNKNSEAFFSSFINDGKYIDSKRNKFLRGEIAFNVPKLELKSNKKNNFIQTQIMNNNYKINYNKISINDYNLASKKLNNNKNSSLNESNIPNSHTKYNSFSNINVKTQGLNKFYNTTTLSLKSNFNKNSNITSLKYFNKYNQKTEPKFNDFKSVSQEIDSNIEINFNLNDLFIFEDRINDIVSAFNNRNNIYDIEASNECNEFMNFYSKSSLKGIFPSFFQKNNQLIIESSTNLSLFFILIIYHLSINNILFNEIISTINIILPLLKLNFALYIKQIQLFYGADIIKKNYSYFQPFNAFLINNDIKNIEGEDDITYEIYQNCRNITNEMKIIMEYYKKININYYDYFIKIFNNISIQKENDLINDFFNGFKNNSSLNLITVNIKKNYSNSKDLKNSSHRRNNFLVKGYINKTKKIDRVPGFKKPEIKNRIEIPYIKESSSKKYTLVLNLNKTLAFYNKGNVNLRTGLYSFLYMIKPYYELISFSSESDNITKSIIKEIESKEKIFDYNFGREHCILYENTLVKDISLIGRDIKNIIIVDYDENNFKLNEENGIKIAKFEGYEKNNKIDNSLFELKKILILIYKANYKDLRKALKDFENDIKNKIR